MGIDVQMEGCKLIATVTVCIILRDLNSSNGTFIRVHGPYPIHGKDQFLLGPHLLKFSLPK